MTEIAVDLDKIDPIMGGDIIVWHAATEPTMQKQEQIGMALAEHAKHSDFLLLIMVGDDTIEHLDEADMLAAGWVRPTADQLFAPDTNDDTQPLSIRLVQAATLDSEPPG